MTEPDYKARLVRLTLTRLAGIGVAAIGGVLIAAPTLPFAVHVIGAVLMIAGIAGHVDHPAPVAAPLAQRGVRRDDEHHRHGVIPAQAQRPS